MIRGIPIAVASQGKTLLASVCLLAIATPAIAATPAGTPIVNTASMQFELNGQTETVASNQVTLLSAELLDVTIVAERTPIAVQGTATVPVPFLITNTGNGTEDFELTVSSDRTGVAVDRIVVDTNKDGVYTAGTDSALASGAPLTLAAGEQARIFVLIDGSQVGAATGITAKVRAKTGSGAAGTVFANAGTNGADAEVGTTGAAASATATLTPPPAGQPTLVKSQSVFAPDGSARAIPGSIITYTLVAGFTSTTRGVAIDDPIPAGTAYVPGSLTLDTRTLTDAGDSDAGSASATSVHVGLGDAAPGTHTIQFSVKIL